MKKKFLTVALAATMVVSSAFSAFAETATSLDNSAGWANPSNAGYEALTGDFDVTYKFKIDSVGAANWNNFVIEMRTGETDNWDYLDIRADAFAFTNGPTFGATFATPATSKLVATWVVPDGHDWATWLAACPGATVEANLVRTGDTFKYKATFSTGTVFTADFSFGDVDVPDAVELTFFGDGAKFSDITFTNNAAGGAGSGSEGTGSEGTGSAGTGSEGTGSAGTGSTNGKAPQTGDAASVATFAAISLAACVAVVATKKNRVTE